MKRIWMSVAGALALIASFAAPAAQGDWPNRAIRLVVSFPAGTQMDSVARIVGDKLASALGQPVVIDNRPGASGNIASEIVARSPPDGYTLLVAGLVVTMLPSTQGARAIDPLRDLSPVSRLTSAPVLIVAKSGYAIDTLDKLVASARRAPGKVTYGTGGVGTPPHLAAVMLGQRAGIELTHVPYTGQSQLVGDLVSGEVPISFLYLGGVAAYVANGQVKPLAVAANHRVAAMPDVPTVAESGYPGFELVSWHGIFAPAGTSSEIVQRLSRALADIVAMPDVRERFATMAVDPAGNTPAEFRSEIANELARWGPLIKAAGIKPD
jgi:tripartite-type tricarboxylate transporter receptor subunit TctC